MRILVTGSSGQLGAEVARQLAAAGDTVLGVDLAAAPTTAHVGDIGDRALVDHLLDRVDAVVHTASLHAPHVPTRSRQDFVDVNVTATLRLLEGAAARRLRRVVYTSTTSVYGAAMVPSDRAVWVTEQLVPQPRDIYDVTKLAAEALCKEVGVPTIVLRTGRFFEESPELIALYRLYRGGDVRDIAASHLLAVHHGAIDFDLFNIAAQSPFRHEDVVELFRDAPSVIRRRAPGFVAQGWPLPDSIDRVYVIDHAVRRLGYLPRH